MATYALQCAVVSERKGHDERDEAVAPPGRFERPTFNLGGCCSVLLSYGGAHRVSGITARGANVHVRRAKTATLKDRATRRAAS